MDNTNGSQNILQTIKFYPHQNSFIIENRKKIITTTDPKMRQKLHKTQCQDDQRGMQLSQRSRRQTDSSTPQYH